MKYYIKTRQWKAIYSTLKTFQGLHVSNERQLRRFLEGVLFVLRSGCQWRLLPRTHGLWRSVHARFFNWSRRDIWKALSEALQTDPDCEAFMIDASIVRAHASCRWIQEKQWA